MASTDLSPGLPRGTDAAVALLSLRPSQRPDRRSDGYARERQASRAYRGVSGWQQRRARAPRIGPTGEDLGPAMYLTADGTGASVRPSKTAGRTGKRTDGSDRTHEVQPGHRLDRRNAQPSHPLLGPSAKWASAAEPPRSGGWPPRTGQTPIRSSEAIRDTLDRQRSQSHPRSALLFAQQRQ